MTRIEAAPRYATERNPNRQTLGRKVGKLMGLIEPTRRDGVRGAMPWQQDALDVACEVDPATGLPWYREVVIVDLRQAGKTSLSRAKVTHRCLTTPRAQVLYTAQDRNMARRRLEKSFRDPLAASALAPYLAPPGPRGILGWDGTNGREKVKFRNAAEIFIIAAQKKTAGHGDTLQEAHLDEYFAQVDGRLEQAVAPTMITVAGAQRFILSAAGDSSSVPLWNKVEAGRARVEAARAARARGEIALESRTCYIEYSSPEDADRADPGVWATTHPAIGYTIDIEDIRADFELMDPAEFDRAYHGWWPRARSRPWVIPQDAWESCGIDEADVDWTGEPMWTIDVAPDRDWSAIGLAAATPIPGRRAYLEVVAHEHGTGWVVSHLVKLRSQLGGNLVGIDGSGPAGALEQDLITAGFDVRRLSMRNKIDACGGLYDDVLATKIAHGHDPLLASNLAAAAKRYSGDAYLWTRGKSLEDITPLYAITIARWLWVDTEPDRYDSIDSTL